MNEPDPIQEIIAIVDQLAPTISAAIGGCDPIIIGAVYPALTAIWLAGNDVPHDKDRTAKVREGLLTDHMEQIRRLIPIMQSIMMERMQPQGRG